MSSARQCPRCGHVYSADVNICVRCGVDLNTGQSFQPVVEHDPDAEREERSRISLIELLGAVLKAYLPGLLHPGVLITSLLVGAFGLTCIGIALTFAILLGFAGIITGVVIGATGLVLYGQAVAWLIGGEFRMLPDLLTDFFGGQWLLFLALIGALFPLIYYVLLAVRGG